MLRVVANGAAKKNAGADPGRAQRNRWADFPDLQCPAGVGEANPPAAVAPGPDADDATRDRRVRSPRTSALVVKRLGTTLCQDADTLSRAGELSNGVLYSLHERPPIVRKTFWS